MTYVATSLITKAQLEELLNKLEGEDYCYFLRWQDKVSGFRKDFPVDISASQGQIFNHMRELRWKPQGDNFSILLLSTKEESVEKARFDTVDFQALPNHWTYRNHKAFVHPADETRFPNPIQDGGINIAQRYFLSQDTGTIHFVALRIQG